MTDLAILFRMPKIELVELVRLLSFRLGGLPDEAVDEARFHAATKQAEEASAAVEAAFREFVRVNELRARDIAEGRRPCADIAAATTAYRIAVRRERETFARLGALRMGVER